ncbi:MAG: hypothetical protein JWQ82_276 [Tardiphaga sp.]|nr:hypothetical protein [Tardiphaga sp.]
MSKLVIAPAVGLLFLMMAERSNPSSFFKQQDWIASSLTVLEGGECKLLAMTSDLT